MKKETIIIYDSVSYFIPYLENHGVKVFPQYQDLDKKPLLTRIILKIVRRISFRMGWFVNFWYGEWKSLASNIEQAIFFATVKKGHILYLKKKNPNIRIIVWYWDPVYRCFNPNLLDDSFEKWSFDKNDCKNYSLNYNTTFYFKEIKLSRSTEKVYDILFLGVDKGRREKLETLQNQLDEQNFITKFHIVSDKSKSLKPVSYNEYLEMIQHSAAILDYIQEGQAGMTLRVMESIFLNKKLITNDETIKHEKFYCSENIFVLGKDNISNLHKFINSPYQKLPDDVVNYYDFSNWIYRFHI